MPLKIAGASLIGKSSTVVVRPIIKPISIGGGGTSSGSGGTSGGGGSYWYENGTVWLMPSNGGAAQIVGFPSVTALNQFTGGLMAPADMPGVYTTFSAQDFPIIFDSAGNPWVFASQFAAPFALNFLTGIAALSGGTLQIPASVGTLVPFSSTPLAVTGPGGSASVPMSYIVVSSASDIANGVATQWG